MKIARKAVMASWAKERPGKSKQYRNNWCAGGIGVKEKWHLQNVCVRKIQSAVISQSFSHLPLRNPASKGNLLASALAATTQCGRSWFATATQALVVPSLRCLSTIQTL